MKINAPIYIMCNRIDTYINYWEGDIHFCLWCSEKLKTAKERYQFSLNKEALIALQCSLKKLIRGKCYKSKYFFTVTYTTDELADGDKFVEEQLDRIDRMVDAFVKQPSLSEGVKTCVLNARSEIFTMKEMHDIAHGKRNDQATSEQWERLLCS